MSKSGDPLTIPHFVSGSVGNLDYSHINQVVDRINALSFFLQPEIVEAIGVLQQNANQNTKHKILYAKIGDEESALSNAKSKFWQWQEVWFNPASGEWEEAENGRSSTQGQYAVSVDSPLGEHKDKNVMIRSHVCASKAAETKNVMVFSTSESPTSLTGVATLISPIGVGGYTASVQTLEDPQPIGLQICYNILEGSEDLLFGSEINTDNCESNPIVEPKTLPQNTTVLVHFKRKKDEEAGIPFDEWEFNCSVPIDVACQCPPDTELLSTFNVTRDQLMMGE